MTSVTLNGETIGKAAGWDEAGCVLVDYAVNRYLAQLDPATKLVTRRCKAIGLLERDLGRSTVLTDDNSTETDAAFVITI